MLSLLKIYSVSPHEKPSAGLGGIDANVQGFVQWPTRDPKAGLPKLLSGFKVRFLDQISKRPCQPDMLLGFILSMRIYSDGHCTKPDVVRRHLKICIYEFQNILLTNFLNSLELHLKYLHNYPQQVLNQWI